MNPPAKKFEVERLDDNHVRVRIRDGEKIVTVVLKLVTERAAEKIESSRDRASRRAEEVAA